jgi:hypothetical protein
LWGLGVGGGLVAAGGDWMRYYVRVRCEGKLFNLFSVLDIVLDEVIICYCLIHFLLCFTCFICFFKWKK